MANNCLVRLIAFYLPQFHPIPENDEWWGKGFTDWRNVAMAKPLFKGHYQPHIPADLGFYDLRLSEVRNAQADLARAYGIYGFCYYHYWFNGKRLLERPFEEVLKSGEPDFPFCLCWANENWTKSWDGQEKEILLKQEYSEEDDLRHILWLAQAFKDKRYIRIEGKPLLLVYRASRLPNPARTAETWRKEATRLGVGEPYLCGVESFPEEHQEPSTIAFDASVEFQPDWTHLGEKLLDRAYKDHTVFRYGDIVERMMNKDKVPYKRFPCVTPSWDNSPRRKSRACIFIESNPEIYERWLRKTLEGLNSSKPEENLVFINAWNEWGEGNHLEPDHRFGRSFLEATRRALWILGFNVDSISSQHIYEDCLALVNLRRKEEAIFGLKRLSASFPKNALFHNDLVALHYQKGEIGRALQDFKSTGEVDYVQDTFASRCKQRSAKRTLYQTFWNVCLFLSKRMKNILNSTVQ